MGAVYLADQPSVGRQAVVKVMHPGLSADPAVAPRFEVEARAASQLNHPHIITIYNYGAMEDGTLFLAMEHVNGPSLEEVVQQGPLSHGRVATIGAQICDALAEAHSHGVVHRDLKPSNIMLTQVGRQQDFVKVLDFGIAKVEGVKMTRTGSVIGTPQYMSPEQLRGDPLDGRSDLYALGGILYQMVSGELPFQADTAAGYMHKHLNEPPVSPALRNPEVEVPPALEAVILRALAKDPAERYQDAEAMGRALEASRDGVPLTAQSSAPIALPRQSAPRTGLWVAIGSGVVLLLAAAATGFVLFTRDRPTDRPAPPEEKKVAWQSVGGPREALEDVPAGASEASADGGNTESSKTETSKTESVPSKAPARFSKPRRARRRKAAARAEREEKKVALAMNRDPSPPAAAATRGAAPAPPPSPSPKIRPHKAPGRYDNMTSAQLEKRLRRVLSTAKIPPSVVGKTFEGYRNAQAFWPQNNLEQLRRRYLIQMLKAYDKPQMQLTPFERRPLAQLRRIFMTMETKARFTTQQREKILDQALASYDKGHFPPKDRAFYKRLALAGMIKNMAADPAKVMR